MSGHEPSIEGLPHEALERLHDLEPTGGSRGLFTSDLTVNEFMLVREAGFRPRGLVFGSSIFHVGVQGRRWGKNVELAKLTAALYSARELAMTRMEEEADVLEADGIVGVRLDIKYYDWGKHSAEFIAIGTAVSATEPGDWRTKKGLPFTSDLSGQDFWTLLQTGYAPVGLVLGNCVYHVGHRNAIGAINQYPRNMEQPKVTQALYEARELAMARMQDEAGSLGAEGVVGVQLVEKSHMMSSHIIEFLAVGTAVRPIAGDHALALPQLTLSLDS
ncbi:MAG: heavy metal-binding domain-containing protein [Acidimicrobiales bacterium]|jgi:uncharacterized protein YbjQ (UPF0145 family)